LRVELSVDVLVLYCTVVSDVFIMSGTERTGGRWSCWNRNHQCCSSTCHIAGSFKVSSRVTDRSHKLHNSV